MRSKALPAFGKLVLALGFGTLLSAAPLAPVELAPSAPKPEPLILRPGEGERRVRRVYGGATAIIKVDRLNGGSRELVMGSEDLPPGQAIAAHSHPGADEIIFVHSGRGVAEIGERTAPIEAGATIYAPRSTRMMLRNTGNEPLAVSFVFSRPGYEEYLRATSVAEGEKVVPLSPQELVALRARHHAHIAFDEPR